MSGIQIPGLTTLFSVSKSGNDQPAPVTEGHAVAEEPKEVTEASEMKNSEEKVADSVATDNVPQQPVYETLPDANANADVDADQVMADHPPPSPPSLTSGLEALLGGLDPLPEPESTTSAPSNDVDGTPQGLESESVAHPDSAEQIGEPMDHDDGNEEGEHPEWEEDSSPYESSSDSSSSDDSDDDSDEEKDYKILGPEETARILMEMDGGSDEEGEGKGKGSGSGMVRTKNELPEAIIPRPDVEIKPDMELIELGVIEHFVDNTAVIKANTTGEYQVLDTGSVLCLEDRTIIAALADVIAAVREPRYTAGFQSQEEIKAFGLEPGTKIFYPPALANLGLTQALKNNKGTDASNWHDEEVAEDEIEFSDDEKEAEYKRQLKAKRKGVRGGRDGPTGRGGRNDAPNAGPSAASAGLKYDDDDDEDGPYRPLTRPTGFGQNPASHEGEGSNGFSAHGGAYRGNRGDFRGRGGRGARGGRGGRGGNPRGGHSLPPRPQGQAAPSFQPSLPQPYNGLPVPPLPVGGQPYAGFSPQPQQSQQPQPPPSQQFPFPWPPNLQQGFVPPPPPQFTGQQGNNMMWLDPALLAALQSQVQNQQGQQNTQWGGQPNNQWPGQGGQG
ncbi:NAF1-domain-containing protein [Poronia punctata]|nr:NAF1-domain-containing protein [Poronia punctata]